MSVYTLGMAIVRWTTFVAVYQTDSFFLLWCRKTVSEFDSPRHSSSAKNLSLIKYLTLSDIQDGSESESAQDWVDHKWFLLDVKFDGTFSWKSVESSLY